MTGQLDLFDGVKLAEPEPTTTVRLGRKTVQIPLRKRRREAIKRLMELLEEMEGKDSTSALTMLVDATSGWIISNYPGSSWNGIPSGLRVTRPIFPVSWSCGEVSRLTSGYSPITWWPFVSRSTRATFTTCWTSAMASGKARLTTTGRTMPACT